MIRSRNPQLRWRLEKISASVRRQRIADFCNWRDDRAVGDWLMLTLRMFNVSESNAHKITGLFLEALNADAA